MVANIYRYVRQIDHLCRRHGGSVAIRIVDLQCLPQRSWDEKEQEAAHRVFKWIS